MLTLAEQQAALLEAVFAWPPDAARQAMASLSVDPGARGLRAYQTNGHDMAQRSLQAAYPVLQQMLGEDSFADLARALWHAHPPVRGDLARWGADLPDFVQASAQLADVPYLADVARLEWCLHRCAHAADRAADPASLQLLVQHDAAQVCLRLAPGCAMVASAWPIASLWAAHQDAAADFAALRDLLQRQVAEQALVWRMGLRPQMRRAAADEAAFLHSVLQGASLDVALQASPDLDFSHWFPAAIQSGLMLGATLLKEEQPR